MKSTLLVGVGNPYFGDDRVGLEVVDRAAREGCPWNLDKLYHIGFDLLDKILKYEKVIIVDACKYGNPPGTILRLKKNDLIMQEFLSINTHGFGIGHVIRVGEMVYGQEMPKEIEAILIEVKNINNFSLICSKEVKRAVEIVIKDLKKLWLKDQKV